MDKNESQIIKGVAIIFMIYCHLFDNLEYVNSCHTILSINGLPLINILTRATHPVPFFLIIGGYGLYRTWKKGDNNRWGRIVKMYVHWWIILGIFIFIGHLVNPEKYPGNMWLFFANATGLLYTYNGEMWFFLPYVILSAMHPFIFRVMDKYKIYYVISTTFLIFLGTSFCISRFGPPFFYKNPIIYHSILIFHILFNFSLGAMAARFCFFEKIKLRIRVSSFIICIAIIVLIAINLFFKYNYLYAFLFILFFNMLKLPLFFQKILRELGNNSMNMWMLHTWFCYYLFRDFIYSFSYPLLIFLVLTIISYISSMIINMLSHPLEQIFLSRKSMKEEPTL